MVKCFELWEARFKILIKENDFETWDILTIIPFILTFPINNKIVNKSGFHWTGEDKRKIKLGFKFKHLLINALCYKKFCYIFNCDTPQ